MELALIQLDKCSSNVQKGHQTACLNQVMKKVTMTAKNIRRDPAEENEDLQRAPRERAPPLQPMPVEARFIAVRVLTIQYGPYSIDIIYSRLTDQKIPIKCQNHSISPNLTF